MVSTPHPSLLTPHGICYPEELPVAQKRGEIIAAIRRQPVLIVCGETGSGKTTQIPKMLLECGITGRIACTQPRRIAARSVAKRIAHELGSELGELVGFKVRFSDQVSERTRIKVLTDGMLLAETQGDRELRQYDAVVVDEAHERSLNIDFLLGYLHDLAARRPELKLVITSATLDADKFSRHFGNAPVIEVSGRLYPVEIRYRPLESRPRPAGGNTVPLSTGERARGEGQQRQRDPESLLEAALLDAVDEVARLGPGDILVFLPGEREIREAAEALRKHHPPHTEILPLFSRLSSTEQDRVFAPHAGRRIVLATNVAETSLTVPGIRYVVDPGQARVLRYSPRNKVDALATEPVSQAAASQRAGRCGRLAAGVCVRLYSEADLASRPRYTDPEILRVSLAGAILRMKSLDLPEPERFPFVDPPPGRLVADGYATLVELDAVDENRRLTTIGRRLAKLPVDPKIGRVLVEAERQHCLAEALVICAALSVHDPRERPAEKAGAADDAHRSFLDERSDFMGVLKLWSLYDEALKHKKSNRRMNEALRDLYLNPNRLREWREVHGQLHALVTEMGMKENVSPATYEQVHRALLAGFIANIGVKDEEGGYAGARGIRFRVHPSSALAKKSPKWVLAAELTETTRLWARMVAKIEPEWAEAAGAHLVSVTHFDPHWERSSAQVVAYARVQLFGLTLVPKRRVHYGPIDPQEAREIFIRTALVAGEFDTRGEFLAHNRDLIAEVAALEEKSRRPDMLVDDEALFRFFDARIPAGIHQGATFEKWRREAESEEAKLLFLTREDVLRRDAGDEFAQLYPDRLALGDVEVTLTYRHEPGHALDGVTATVPLALLNRIDGGRAEWLVPGLIREKIATMLKALPKHQRRVLVPVPEAVTAALTEMETKGTLVDALSAWIAGRTREAVDHDAWRDLPAHLQMNFRVVDDAGQEIAMGRELAALRKQLGAAAQMSFRDAAETPFESSGHRRWDFGDLPEEIAFNRGRTQVTGYPAINDDGDSVSVKLFDTREAAIASHRAGVVRLIRLILAEHLRQLDKRLSDVKLAAAWRPLGDGEHMKRELTAAICDRAFLGEDAPPRDARAFEEQLKRARARLVPVTDGLLRTLSDILAAAQNVKTRLDKGLPFPHAAKDMKEQLAALVHPGFVVGTPWERLSQLVRYLGGMDRRMDKLAERMQQDQRHTATIHTFQERLRAKADALRKAHQPVPSTFDDFRWEIEELRISLFAQELKTPHPVSAKRLDAQWNKILA